MRTSAPKEMPTAMSSTPDTSEATSRAITAERAETIRTAFERNARAVGLRPSIGRGTAVTRVRLSDGLTCEIDDGAWSLTADMSEKYGGRRAGPDPGVFGRAGLGSCLAAGYAMWAARRGVPIDDLIVEVHADYDARGELGVDESVRPAYSEVRIVVDVRSSAAEADVAAVLAEAERHSPWLQVFREPVRVVRETTITGKSDGDD